MKSLNWIMSVALLMGVSNFALAESDVEAGAKLATKQCDSCHGKDGKSTNPAFPKLTGLEKNYLIKSLGEYKSGAKKEAMMNMLMKNISDDDIKKLAAFYASIK